MAWVVAIASGAARGRQVVGVASSDQEGMELDSVGKAVAAEIGSLEERVGQAEWAGLRVLLAETELSYQVAAVGMGMGLLVVADSDTAVEWEWDPVERVVGRRGEAAAWEFFAACGAEETQ